MTASLAQLQRRADRLRLELAKRKARSANFDPTHRVTKLPSVEDWPSFARRTWIRTAGTVAPFDPYAYQIDLVNSINAHPLSLIHI